MAAPKKESLDYFNVDTKFENNMETFELAQGNDALAFMIKVWQSAYQKVNGEIPMGSPVELLGFAAKCRVLPERFAILLEDALTLKLLDREAYEQRKVLTSNGIKKRIAKIHKERDRKRRGCSAEQLGNNFGITSEESESIQSTTMERARNNAGSLSFPLVYNNKEKGEPGYELKPEVCEIIDKIYGAGCSAYYALQCRDILKSSGKTTPDFEAYTKKILRADKSAKQNFFHKNHRKPS